MQSLINFQDNCVQFDFQNKPGQQIKIVGTFDDPYFCGKDVCAILEYSNVKKALQEHVKPKHKKDLQTLIRELGPVSGPNSITEIPNLKPSYHDGKAVYISEPGLYSLIMSSRTSFAEIFQDFVYEQILPSIRKRGRFQLEQQLAVKDDKIDELTALIKQMDMRSRETEIRFDAKLDEMIIQNNELLDQNNELLDTAGQQTVQIETIQHKLGISVKDRAPLPKQKSKQERFVLIKRTQKRNGIEPEYMYYTIRAQDSRVKLSLRTQEALYNIEILLDLTCHPNSKTFYNRIKEDLIEKGVQFSYNNISIENSEIDEDVLITLMKKINDEKLDV
jgi:prophage antirepressor-like protein